MSTRVVGIKGLSRSYEVILWCLGLKGGMSPLVILSICILVVIIIIFRWNVEFKLMISIALQKIIMSFILPLTSKYLINNSYFMFGKDNDIWLE